MNAFEAQQEVETGFVQLAKPNGGVFRFIIFNSQVQALTFNDLPLEEGDDRGPSAEDLACPEGRAEREVRQVRCHRPPRQGLPLA